MQKILVTFLILSAGLCLAEDEDQYDMAIDRMTADLMDEAPMEDGVPEDTNLQEKVQGSSAGCRAVVDGTVDLHTDKYEGKSWNWNNKAFKKIEYYNCRKVTAIDNDYDRYKQNVEKSGTGKFETSWAGDLRNDVLRIDLYAYKTASPTMSPTKHPTRNPTRTPTKYPTHNPTPRPTQHPTAEPTNAPTEVPTTHAPSPSPSHTPTDEPTAEPTHAPTDRPTAHPTRDPTDDPTANPTARPTHLPTATPTRSPTRPACRVKVQPQGTVYETQDFRSVNWEGQKFDSLEYTNCKRVTAFDDDYSQWTQNVAVAGSGKLVANYDLENDLKAIDMQAFECHSGCTYGEE